MSDDSLLNQIYDLLAKGGGKNIHELIEIKKKEYDISSDRQLATILGINKDTLNRIITGESQKVDLISVIKISNFLGLRIEDTVQIYISSLKSEGISEIEETRKTSFIMRNFDLKGLKKIGFIQSITDFKAIEQRINQFFGLNSIFEYESELAYPLFSRSKVNPNDKMRIFWIKSAYNQFDKIKNPNEFDYEEFKKMIPKIRAYTRKEKNGLVTVAKALFQVGITVIVQKYITKTSVYGATFIINNKPCIILTDYSSTYDKLWFTLMHELAHVYFDLEDLKTQKFHLSGEIDLLALDEDRANHFAREMLFPDERLEFIQSYINSPLYIDTYAKENNIHPSIIYGFYLHDKMEEGMNLYGYYRHHLPSSEDAIKELKISPWSDANSTTQMEVIKENILQQ